jgi:hypothetical protein
VQLNPRFQICKQNFMAGDNHPDARVDAWLQALDVRHLADLTPSEVARALRALSSLYVERRARLADGGALGTAGKRAAFALFYAPIHFFLVRHVVRALAPAPVARIHDLGCGTGSAGAAWGLETPGARISGVDRHPWAVAEANWAYRTLGLDGRAVQQDVARARLGPAPRTGIVAAYTVNELSDPVRHELLTRFLEARASGASILVIEPLARGVTPWWSAWEAAVVAAGGRSDEWRVPAVLPRRQRDLARAAGLRPTELLARSLFAPPAAAPGRKPGG